MSALFDTYLVPLALVIASASVWEIGRRIAMTLGIPWVAHRLFVWEFADKMTAYRGIAEGCEKRAICASLHDDANSKRSERCERILARAFRECAMVWALGRSR